MKIKMKMKMKILLLTLSITMLAGCTTVHYPDAEYRSSVDQYGRKDMTRIDICHYFLGTCWFPQHDSYTTPAQSNHNAALQAEEKRLERAMRRAHRE